MLEVTNLEVFNFEGAIRGMRNPFKNTDKGDSLFTTAHEGWVEEIINDWVDKTYYSYDDNRSIEEQRAIDEEYEENVESLFDEAYNKTYYKYNEIIVANILGPKDLALAQKLVKAGSPHDKFMRQIFVSMDIKAPLYWWKEMDTYKVGTTANSESTMHTITKTGFTIDDFSYDESFYNNNDLTIQTGMTVLVQQILLLNKLRDYYLNEKDPTRKKQIWRTIIQMLPSSYMQKRTWSGSYGTLRPLIKQRDGHRLSEWKTFSDKVKELPYADELIFYKGE